MRPNRWFIGAWGPSLCALVMCGCGGWGVSAVREAGSPTQRLVAASGVVRPMEGRLSAVPAWGACEEVEGTVVSLAEPSCGRGERSPARVAAVGRLLRGEGAGLTADDRRRLRALVGLLWNEDEGELGSAVARLEELTGRHPSDAALWSDLAAARLLRAQRTESSFELLGALDAVERALETEPDRVEALFNRALAVEKLGMLRLAEAAWRRFVEVEGDAAWIGEGERRLARVRKEREITPGGSEEIRLEALRRAWPAWAETVVAGGDSSTERLEELGGRHAAASGDGLLLDAALHAARLDAGARARLARAVLDLESGSRALDGLEAGDPTAELLSRSSAELERLGSPLVHWARLKSVIAAIYEQRWLEVGPAAERLAAASEGYPVVRGRALWMQGLAFCYHGRRAEAIERYREARRLFERAGERVFTGAVRFLIAESYQEVGSYTEAWEHRYRALTSVPLLARAEPYRAHNVLYDSAAASLEQGLPRPARDFAEEALALAQGRDDPVGRTEARLLRARSLAALGRDREAGLDLEAGLEEARSLANEGLRERLVADLDRTLAGTVVASEPERALALLDGAEEFDRSTGHRRYLTELAMTRAEARLALGRQEGAIEDLESVLEVLREDRRSLDAPARRIACARRARPALDRLVALLVETGDPDDVAFSLVESMRALELVGAGASDRLRAAEIARRLAPGTVVWSFHATAESLVEWTITVDGAHREVTGVPRSELEELRGALSGLGGLSLAEGRELLGAAFTAFAGPVANDLRAAKRIVVVPDGLFQDVPFHALLDPVGGRYLIEDRELLIVPAAGLVGRSASPRGPEGTATAILVGSPDLAGSAVGRGLPRLAAAAAGRDAIASLYARAIVLDGAEADRASLAGLDHRADVLEFDVHAVGTPSGPALVLAGENGLLGAADIGPELLHGARLVILGGCATAAGPRDPFEGSMGLARAFLGAGARTVIATLWPVVDGDVSAILPRIHRHLAAGERPAAAFREALLEGIPDLQDDGALGDWAGLQLVTADAES